MGETLRLKSYRETRKRAEGGVMLDYPITDVRVDGSAKYVFAVLRHTNHYGRLLATFSRVKDVISQENPNANMNFLQDPKVEMGIEVVGNIKQSITGLFKLGYISQVTYDLICDDLHQETPAPEIAGLTM